ncbi:MAG: hypothetical protein M1587_06295 [Thaumarchaeota archaeon]|nr:hypothetical protein [Nitrososphaerota archaeon]MCL5066745.1 hypothetical protein [Nitrososphaerota archaeon]
MIVIVVVVAVGAYFALTLGSTVTTTPTSTSTVSSTTTTTSVSETSSSTEHTTTTSSSSTQTTTTGTTTESISYVESASELFGNFTQMKMRFDSIYHGDTSNSTIEFVVLGTPIVNDTRLTEVNYTFTTVGSTGASNSTAVLYYDSNWNVTLATLDGQNFTGTVAAAFTNIYTGIFAAFFTVQNQYALNSYFYGQLQIQNTGPHTFGNTSMQVTTYTASNVQYGNETISTATIKIGSIDGTNFGMLVGLYVVGSDPTGPFTYNWQLVSATRA